MIDASLILAISITLVLSNLILLNQANTEFTNIDENRTSKLALVTKMKRVIRDRSIAMLDMAAEKDVWAFQDKYLHFHKLAVEFIGTRGEFVAIGLQKSEEKEFQNVLLSIQKTESLQGDIVERIRTALMSDTSINNILYEISTEDFPKEFELLGQMDSLYNRIIENSNLQRMDTKEKYQRVIIVVSIVSFVFILTIIMLMARSLRKIRNIEMDLLEKTESLNWDATHDPLTNIFNRRWLEHKIDNLLEKTQKEGDEHSLLYIDLDGFKEINDTHGHIAGDNYLINFCREVEHGIRQNDTFCRMGGDEFAVLLENCTPEVSLKIANELLHRIGKSVLDFDGTSLNASCSIGVCQFSSIDIDFDNLVHRADELCYQAKRKGKNRIEVGNFN